MLLEGRESNGDIEWKYIRPAICSYSYICFAITLWKTYYNNYSHLIMYGIYTPHFFVKMTGHGFDNDNKPKYRILIQLTIESWL